MPCGIIPSGRAPKSIVVHSPVPVTHIFNNKDYLNNKDLGEPTVLNVLHQTRSPQKRQAHLLLYYYCLCKSFNELFSLANGELRSRKRMQRYTLFRFPQNIHKKNIHFNPIFNILKRFKRSKIPLHLIYINRQTS